MGTNQIEWSGGRVTNTRLVPKYACLLSWLIVVLAFSVILCSLASAQAVERKCLDCHDKGKIREALKAEHRHPPFAEKDCESCHQKHTEGEEPYIAKPPELCYGCHDDKEEEFKKKHVHTPVKQNCALCHDPHGSENKFMLSAEGNDLCASCHEAEVPPEGEKAEGLSIHPPAQEDCKSCHNPHAADNPFNLDSSVPELCTMCHDTEDKGFSDAHTEMPVQEAACTGCHSPHVSSNKKLIQENVHFPVAEGRCTFCHKAESANGKVELNLPVPNLCYMCHSSLKKDFEKEHQHPPAVEGECVSCHNTHASKQKSLLIESPPGLCLQCHDDMKELVKRRNAHPPFQENCVTCHQPHSSDYEGILKTAQGELCLSCHTGKQEGMDAAGMVHPPVKEGKCTSCHNPHVSDHDAQLREEGKALCLTCHKEIKARLGKKFPHTTAKEENCDMCHQSHTSRFPSLLTGRKDEICFECHDKAEFLSNEFVHFPVSQGKCLLCHDPHGTNNVKHLRRNASELCETCHSGQAMIIPHPVGVKPDKSIDVHSGDALTLDVEGKVVCFTCHNPHGSEHQFFLRMQVGENGLCGKCHAK